MMQCIFLTAEEGGMRRVLMGLIVLVVVIQFVPVTRDNPPAADPIVFADPAVEAIAKKGCYDCHSNVNEWPWYAYVAPVSWVVVHHVEEGRAVINFSDIAMTLAHGGEHGGPHPVEEILEHSEEEMERGSMPPAYYQLTHPASKLTAEEQAQLLAGIRQALAGK